MGIFKILYFFVDIFLLIVLALRKIFSGKSKFLGCVKKCIFAGLDDEVDDDDDNDDDNDDDDDDGVIDDNVNDGEGDYDEDNNHKSDYNYNYNKRSDTRK